MTKFVPKSNTLFITKNAFKKADNHPDYKGKITLVGPLPAGEYDIGLYIKKSEKGNSFMSGSIKPAFAKDDGYSPKKASPSVKAEEDSDDTIPF